MRKTVMVCAVVSLVGFIALSQVWSESVRFSTTRTVIVNGLELKPGDYELEWDKPGPWVRLYGEGDFISFLGVKMEPLGSGKPNTLLIEGNGKLAEYRTSRRKILFATPQDRNLHMAKLGLKLEPTRTSQ